MNGDGPVAPLVGVVTPVYNGAPWLPTCIESVLNQTWSRWRYTVLDNCSTDGSGEIAESYAAKDPRIRVVHNEDFLDQVANLNKAMRLAADEDVDYVKPVLADDWIHPPCLEEMVRVARAHPTTGLVASLCQEEERVTCGGLALGRELYSGREVCRLSLLEGLFVFGSPNNLLYRAEIVRDRRPFFNPESPHEDTEACYEILTGWDLGYVHEVLSFTRRQNESETSFRFHLDAEHRLDKLITAKKYGPHYLEADEHRANLEREKRRYYDFLARRSLIRTGGEFWAYHRRGLATAGLAFERGRYLHALVRAARDQLRRPGETLGKVGRTLRRTLRR
jgi:glycosyltransferase involved in cell wall biosynthesis